jgi:citrate synthase
VLLLLWGVRRREEEEEKEKVHGEEQEEQQEEEEQRLLSSRQAALGRRQFTNSSALLRDSKRAQSLQLSRNFREHQQCQTEEGTVLVAPRASSAVHPRLAMPLVVAIVATTEEEETVAAKRGAEEIEAVMAAAVVVVAAAAVQNFTSEVSASTPAKKLWSRSSPSAYPKKFVSRCACFRASFVYFR